MEIAILGLTATPCVMPENIEDDYDSKFIRDTLKFFELEKEGPTFVYTLQQGIKDGYLVPYYTYEAKTIKMSEDDGIKIHRNEIDWGYLSEKDKKELEEIFDKEDEHVFSHSTLERKISIPKRNESLVREFKNILENGYVDSNGNKYYPSAGKTLVFAVNQRHAITLAKLFDSALRSSELSPSKRYADYVISDLNQDDSQEAKEKIKRFKEEEYPKIMISVDMLDTGFDFPEITNLIFARFTQSNIKYRQMRGRGTRPAPHIKKKCFWMFDFVGNFAFHGENEGGEGGKIVDKKKGKKSLGNKLIELEGVDDWIDPASRAIVFLDDNGNIEQKNETKEKIEKMGIKIESYLGELEKQNLTFEQEELIYLIGQRLKANIENAGLVEIEKSGAVVCFASKTAIKNLSLT